MTNLCFRALVLCGDGAHGLLLLLWLTALGGDQRQQRIGQFHGPSIEQELFGKGGLPGVWMGDDGKGAPPRYGVAHGL